MPKQTLDSLFLVLFYFLSFKSGEKNSAYLDNKDIPDNHALVLYTLEEGREKPDACISNFILT